LFELQKFMKTQPGGGYPEKVDNILLKFAPGVQYIQCTNSDLGLLREVLASGRMAAVTYCGRDSHYGGQQVPHMVDLVHLSDRWAAVSDNNFPGDNQIMWMAVSEFESRWKGYGSGWAVILLNPGPPPVPRE
jgi:hypothetical protein